MAPAADDPLSLRASDADRQAITDALGNAYAEGRLSLVEYHERLDAALAAKTYADLAPLLADLPRDPRTPDVTAGALTPVSRPNLPAPSTGPDPGDRRVVAVLSEQRLGAELEIGATGSVLAVLGEATLDLGRATFRSAITSLSVSALLGQANVIVPSDAVVTMNVTPVLGEARGPEPEPGQSGGGAGPRIEISGVALLGAVYVTRASSRPGLPQPPQPPRELA